MAQDITKISKGYPIWIQQSAQNAFRTLETKQGNYTFWEKKKGDLGYNFSNIRGIFREYLQSMNVRNLFEEYTSNILGDIPCIWA